MAVDITRGPSALTRRAKQDRPEVFYELTRSMCPQCRAIIDAQILLRDNKVYMRKRCKEHGVFEALVYGDAQMYTSSLKFNKPGTIPFKFSTEVREGCPHDCGLCPDHLQHACLGIIEVNTACDMACPVCFANAGCDLPGVAGLGDLAKRVFMLMLTDFMDPWTFNVRNVMKCCKDVLLPDGRQIPFCAYNNVGYREEVTAQAG